MTVLTKSPDPPSRVIPYSFLGFRVWGSGRFCGFRFRVDGCLQSSDSRQGADPVGSMQKLHCLLSWQLHPLQEQLATFLQICMRSIESQTLVVMCFYRPEISMVQVTSK